VERLEIVTIDWEDTVGKRGLLLVAGVAVLGGVVVFCLTQHSATEPRVDLLSLDFSEAAIPNTWECSWCTTEVAAEWDYVVEDNPELYWEPSTGLSSTRLRVIHWVDANHGYVIQATVIDYKCPIAASLNFRLNDPLERLRGTFWNFTYAREDAVPQDWSWVNEAADEDAVRCGDGTQERCTGWFYQARHGQYYILVYFYQDLGIETFRAIARAIDEQFVLALR